MITEWNFNNTLVKITGDYSQHPVIVTKEVYEYFGDSETTFHNCKALCKEGYTPKASGIETMRDLELTLENKACDSRCQNRYWRYGTIYPTVYEYVRGYYHIDGDYAVFSGGTKVKLQSA